MNEIILNISIIIFLISIILMIVSHSKLKKNKIKLIKDKKSREFLSINFTSYYANFEFLAEKCYKIIYTDEILVYALDGMKHDKLPFDEITIKFINLFFKMIGPNIKMEFIFLFGDIETLSFALVNFFNDTYENDEIRKAQQEEILK